MKASLYTAERLDLVGALIPLLEGTSHWESRWDIEWYVSKCMMAGFCKTEDQMRLCASRWIAGKRKINAPGTARRERDAKRMREMLANTPPELLKAVQEVVAEQTKAVEQYRAGTEKALNALVGGVMKRFKSDPATVRELLIKQIKETA
jgi:hypothetical protein